MTSRLLTLLTLATAALAKDVLFPQPGLSVLNDALTAASGDGYSHRTVTEYDPNVIPVDCHREALSEADGGQGQKCDVPSMEVWSVKYDDCDEPWVMCRCPDAPVSRETMMDQFGRLAPNQRAPVRHLMAFKGDGWAYKFAYDLVLMGDVGSLTVMTHEGAHAFDKDQSKDPAFLDAMNADACWADDYAKINGEPNDKGEIHPEEVWAQALVLRRYQQKVGPLPKDASCMANQLAVVGAQTDARLAEPRCDMSTKHPLDRDVPKTNDPAPPAKRDLLQARAQTHSVGYPIPHPIHE